MREFAYINICKYMHVFIRVYEYVYKTYMKIRLLKLSFHEKT